ncbi:MAG: glycosyltransferase family 4 protein [Candidatus Zixiibacteriota bacterium]
MNEANNTSPLKVLYVTHNYIRHKGDFAGVFLHLLARKLKEKNIEIHVVAPHDAGLSEFEEIDGIKIYRFRYADDDNETFAYRGDMHRQLFKNPFKIFRLLKFLNESFKLACKIIDRENINVANIHWMVPNGIVAKKLAKKYNKGLSLFISSHGTDVRILTKFPMLFSYLKPAAKASKQWIVVSSFLKKMITAKDISLEEKIKVVSLPNDETLFYPDSNIHKKKNLIVSVSRHTVQKRLLYLVKAIKIVKDSIPDINVEIYGDGPERDKLAGLISELNLENNIALLNPVPQIDLKNIYNKASAVVLNSYEEGFGLALTEAMLCETAVVGTDSGGITDIIDNNETGLLVPLDNEQKLADAVIMILSDENLRKKLAESGYQKARAKFSAESSANQYARLYNQA